MGGTPCNKRVSSLLAGHKECLIPIYFTPNSILLAAGEGLGAVGSSVIAGILDVVSLRHEENNEPRPQCAGDKLFVTTAPCGNDVHVRSNLLLEI